MLKVESTVPCEGLREFIRCYVQREAHLGGVDLVEPVVARLGTMLEFEFAGAYTILSYGTDALNQTWPLSLIAPMTGRSKRLIIRGHVESMVVMFQPLGFHALFGAPTLEFAEGGIEARTVLGAGVSGLHERLGNVRSFGARVAMLDGYFLERMRARVADDPVRRGLRLLMAPGRDVGAGVRVGDVARRMGLGVRQLERRALEYAGVTPKAMTRISRFSRALGLRSAHGAGLSWTEIAHRAGYYDQMHMVREFKDLAGEAPGSAEGEIAPEHLVNFAG